MNSERISALPGGAPLASVSVVKDNKRCPHNLLESGQTQFSHPLLPCHVLDHGSC